VRLIVGLGNPGREYAQTRHNIGYGVVDAFAEENATARWASRCQSLVCRTEIAGKEIVLAKPLTFMNLSGRAVRLLLSEFRLGAPELIVVYDDLDLALGRIRIRERGSAGGHNGMDSILRSLESDQVLRVRIGIGEENMPEDKAAFVLSDFPAECAAQVSEMIDRAKEAVKAILRDGVSHAMSCFNG